MRTRSISAFLLPAVILATTLAIPNAVVAGGGTERSKQVFPNPFFKDTTFQLSLPKAANIRITVYDMLGRQIRMLYNGVHDPGEYPIYWDGNDDANTQVAVGIFICVLFSDGIAVKSVKVIKIRA